VTRLLTSQYTALCGTSTTCSSTGQVLGGAPTPVAFSTVWSKWRRKRVCAACARGPRSPTAELHHAEGRHPPWPSPQGTVGVGRRGDPNDLRPTRRGSCPRAGRDRRGQPRAEPARRRPAAARRPRRPHRLRRLPVAHWRNIWSTNPLERLNREVKRRTDVVGIFPDDNALLRLTSCVLMEAHDEWQVSPTAATCPKNP
jgi:hypothetical protein